MINEIKRYAPVDVDPKRGNCQLVAIATVARYHGVDCLVQDIEEMYRSLFKPGPRWTGGCSNYRALVLLDKLGFNPLLVEVKNRPVLRHWARGMNFEKPTIVGIRGHSVVIWGHTITDQGGAVDQSEHRSRRARVLTYFKVEKKHD